MITFVERLLRIQTRIATARQHTRDPEAERLLLIAMEEMRRVIADAQADEVTGLEYRG